MELCKGFKDWLVCIECTHLCTRTCPIESDDVLEEMEKQIRISSVSWTAEKKAK